MAEVNAPDPLKSEQKVLADAMEAMITMMSRMYKNQVLLEMNKGTVEKFSDAQTGNYAAILTKLSKKVSKSLLKRFDNKRIKELSQRVLEKNDKRSRKILYDRLSKDIGIDPAKLLKRDGTQFTFNALVIENSQWVEKLRDDTLEMYTANTLRAMTLGTPIEEILQQFDGMVEKRRGHARFTARNQIASFNSIMNKTRAQKLGIKKAVWKTSSDERVRASHEARDGKEFKLSEGLYSSVDGKTLLPGTDYNCFPGELKINNASSCCKFFRRNYTGKLASIVSDDGSVLSSTANHPVLTTDGFKAAHLINASDYIVKVIDDTLEIIELYGKDVKPTFEQLFRSLNFLGVEHTIAPSFSGKFHGDISDSEIDIVSMDSLLTSEVNGSVAEKFSKLSLSESEKVAVLDFFTCIGGGLSSFKAASGSFNREMSCINLVRSCFVAHLTPLERFCFALGSWYDISINKPVSYSASAGVEVFRDTVFALSVLVHGNYIFDRKINAFKSGRLNTGENKTNILGAFSKAGWVHGDSKGGLFDESAIKYKICSVTDNVISNFSGHIYNLETISNDYTVETTTVSNCRCSYRMILEDEE